jgi:hypothetical protein
MSRCMCFMRCASFSGTSSVEDFRPNKDNKDCNAPREGVLDDVSGILHLKIRELVIYSPHIAPAKWLNWGIFLT